MLTNLSGQLLRKNYSVNGNQLKKKKNELNTRFNMTFKDIFLNNPGKKFTGKALKSLVKTDNFYKEFLDFRDSKVLPVLKIREMGVIKYVYSTNKWLKKNHNATLAKDINKKKKRFVN